MERCRREGAPATRAMGLVEAIPVACELLEMPGLDAVSGRVRGAALGSWDRKKPTDLLENMLDSVFFVIFLR